jgi:methylamine dehydrogenase accessory protein MauD
MGSVQTSLAVLWLVVIVLAILVLALIRQIGILHERIAPMGALVMDRGPKIGEIAPAFTMIGMAGEGVAIGTPNTLSTLLFFTSPTCPVCKKLLSVIGLIQGAERSWLTVILISDGQESVREHSAHAKKIAGIPYVLSEALGLAFQVSRVPYAVLIGTDARIKAKGLVNSREQIESLFTAKELGVSSIQELLNRRDPDPRATLTAEKM